MPADSSARRSLQFAPDDLGAVLGNLAGAYARIDELEEPLPPVRFPARERGRAPEIQENPCNAWAWLARVRGAAEGPLAGWRVAVKDNTAVAGVPMSSGSAVLEDYVPPVDATIVDRLLAAGADVLGKAACEDLCFSGGSHTSVTGPVLNPHDPERMSGGSSSGSAVLVALGEVDLATGTDQGGSIAIPSAWCGVVGIKPTFGLVPYSGILPVEWSIDHPGLMARSVADIGRALDVVAGPDGLDPRQTIAPAVAGGAYADAALADADGLRVALLRDGFGWTDASDPRVDALVASRIREVFGEGIAEVTAPMHRDAPCIMAAISNEGAYRTLFHPAPTGPPGAGLHLPGISEAWARGMALHAHELSPTVLAMARSGEQALTQWRGRHYARAQNLRRALAAQYERALHDADALAMPAVPFLPRRFPAPDATPLEIVEAAFQSLNTSAFDLTGHPTLTLPVGFVEGLPVGVMLVGRRGGERDLLALGARVERALEPRPDAAPMLEVGKPTS